MLQRMTLCADQHQSARTPKPLLFLECNLVLAVRKRCSRLARSLSPGRACLTNPSGSCRTIAA